MIQPIRRKKSAMQKTKKEIMADLLRDAIFAGELQPGERLLQEDLAERFKISQTPVREAIQQLVAEGVLSHSPYKGVQVAEVDLDSAQEIYLIRGALERLVTRMAVPNLKIFEIKRLREIHGEVERFYTQPTTNQILTLNNEFHMTIYRAAEMPRLYQMIRSLWIKTPWDTLFVIPERARMVIDEHRRVIEAIEHGDAEAAGEAMQNHLEAGAATLARFLKREQANKE